MQPVRTLALAIAIGSAVTSVISLAGGCAQLPGTGAPVVAKKFTTMSFSLDVKGSQVRRLLQAANDPLSNVTADHVKSVVITLQDTAADAGPASEARIENFSAAGSTVSFTNLVMGHRYKISCRALGVDPNGDLNNQAADLTDPDAAKSTAYLDVPDLVNGTVDQDATGHLTDTIGTPLLEQKLPLTLYTPIFHGHAQSGINVATGEVTSTEDDVVVTGGVDTSLTLASDTGTKNYMGYWNYRSDDPNGGSNTDRGNEAHMVLKLYGLTAGSSITRIILNEEFANGDLYRYDTFGYPIADGQGGGQMVGVYTADHSTHMLVRGTLPVTGTNLTLNLYTDPRDEAGLGNLRAGAKVDLSVITTAGTITLNDVIL